MVVWGLWQDGRLLFSTGSESRKARNLAHNPNCVACTERANEAVTVEGVAEIAHVAARRKSLAAACQLALSSGRVNENTEPLPNWLTTPIVPP